MTAKRRRYTAPKDEDRCSQTVRLDDGSTACCMRPAKTDGLCWQHARIADDLKQRGIDVVPVTITEDML